MATQLKKVVAPTGGDYTALETCMNANEQNLVTADKYFDVEISGSWSTADSTWCNVENYTTDSTRYINIYTTGTARHDGTNKSVSGRNNYVITINSNYAIGVLSNNVTVDGVEVVGGTGNSEGLRSTGNNVTFKNNVVRTTYNTIWPSSGTATVINNICTVTGSSINVRLGATTVYLANNTVLGGSYGIYRTAGTVTAYNNIAYNTSTADYYGAFGTTSNNISQDTTSPDSSYREKTLTFVSTASGSENLHLVSSDTDAIDKGADLSATFKSDIDGMWRGSTWSIGADQRASFVVAPTGGDYTALETCMNAQESDITAKGFMNVEISGTWSSADTTAVTVHNYTTTASDYINIYTTGSARHNGIVATATGGKGTNYRITTTNTNVITVTSKYVTLNGLELYGWSSDVLVRSGVIANDDGRYLTVDSCIFHDLAGDGFGVYASWTAYVRNSLFYNFTVSDGYVRAIYVPYGTVYNVTAVDINSKTTGYSPAIYTGSDVTVSNVICLIKAGADGAAFGATNPSYSISSDATADGTGCVINKTVANLAFVSATDFHLTSASTDAIGAGTDLSAVFTTDIDGTTRPTGAGTWDIGADEYIVTVTGVAWGEQNSTETPEAWSVWDNGSAGAINVSGDASWGKFVFNTSAIGHSPVKDFGDADTKVFTITLNKYGTGSGSPTIYIRGSASTFNQDDGSPSWEAYTGPTQREWRYVQVKLLGV